MNKLFPNAIEHLRSIPRGTNPELMSEIDRAIQILNGRPGIDEKYVNLILRMDRYVAQLQDNKSTIESFIEQSSNPIAAPHFKGQIKMINKIISDLKWMRARNDDLMKILIGKDKPQ